VRELENAVERAVVLSRGNPITSEHLPFANRREAKDRKALAERRTRLDKDEASLDGRREELEADEAAATAVANGNGAGVGGAGNGAAVGESGSFKERVESLERQLIKEALDRAGGNRTKAAEELGIYRRLLYAKIKEYGLGE
jgi:DNA-binding NtrC family response regulator